MEMQGGWNEAKRKLNRNMFALIFAAAVPVVLMIGLLAILRYHVHREQVQKMYNISLPPGAKDSIPAYPGDYITVTSNPQTGPYCLTRGIWLIEVADKRGEGLVVLRGHQTDEAGVTTRVTLTSTTNHFVENNSRIAFALTSKNSSSFDKVSGAFWGNDKVAKDPK